MSRLQGLGDGLNIPTDLFTAYDTSPMTAASLTAPLSVTAPAATGFSTIFSNIATAAEKYAPQIINSVIAHKAPAPAAPTVVQAPPAAAPASVNARGWLLPAGLAAVAAGGFLMLRGGGRRAPR
jgi:hypothetical protein